MTVTNLTGETWVINESPIFAETFTYSVNFESNNIQFSTFACVQLSRPDVLKYDNVMVYAGNWSDETYRTITFETAPTGELLTWLQANAVKQEQELGYEVTFVTNGGTSVTKLENVEELPTPLPTPTKANSKFVGWYYDSGLTTRAYAGETITANVTLYAKWYANMSDFYQDVADAIRSKNGETNPIKHTDFAYKIKNILDGIETALDAILGV